MNKLQVLRLIPHLGELHVPDSKEPHLGNIRKARNRTAKTCKHTIHSCLSVVCLLELLEISKKTLNKKTASHFYIGPSHRTATKHPQTVLRRHAKAICSFSSASARRSFRSTTVCNVFIPVTIVWIAVEGVMKTGRVGGRNKQYEKNTRG